jgi:SAM-dependent methyltransferase
MISEESVRSNVHRYSIREGYVVRDVPDYFDDDLGDVIWQPDVYADAGRIGEWLRARRIVDVGAGDGTKLAGLHPRFDIIGIDYGANVERSAARYPFGAWRHHDLDAGEPLPVSDSELRESVVVCSDVIEHLRAPHVLLAKLLATLHHASAILISTPERELWHGVRSEGPPRNRHHVREWSIREFGHLLAAAGFDHLSIGLTRSNDRTEEPFTIEALATADAATLDALVPLLINRPVPPARHALKARLVRAARILRYG